MTTTTPDRDERMIDRPRTLLESLRTYVHGYTVMNTHKHIITLSQHRGFVVRHICQRAAQTAKQPKTAARSGSRFGMPSSIITNRSCRASIPPLPLVHCMRCCPLSPSRSGKAEEALNLQEKASRSFLFSRARGVLAWAKRGKPCGCMLCRPAGRVPGQDARCSESSCMGLWKIPSHGTLQLCDGDAVPEGPDWAGGANEWMGRAGLPSDF